MGEGEGEEKAAADEAANAAADSAQASDQGKASAPADATGTALAPGQIDPTRWLPAKDKALGLPADAVTTVWENVVYQPEAIVLEAKGAEALVDHARDEGRYVFDAAKLKAAGVSFEKGKAFMIPGLALGRVTEVSESGGKITVRSEAVGLNAVIKDGTVGWRAALPLDPSHVVAWVDPSGERLPADELREESASSMLAFPAPTRAGRTHFPELSGLYAPAPTAPGRMKWTYSKAGIGYELELEARGDEAKVLIKATKASGGNTEMQYWAKGTFKQVYVNAKGEYKDGEVQSLEYSQPDMVGDFEIAIAAAGSGDGNIDFTLPEAVLRYVYPVGPIPVVVEIKAKMIGRVSVPSKGSATAKAKFKWSGQAGLSYEGTDVKARGVFNEVDIDANPFDSAANIGRAVDAQWGVGIPRVSVSAFGTFLVPYIQPGITIGSRLQWGPVCKSGYVRFNVIAGYDFGVMGVKLAGDKVELHKKEKRAPEGGCK